MDGSLHQDAEVERWLAGWLMKAGEMGERMKVQRVDGWMNGRE